MTNNLLHIQLFFVINSFIQLICLINLTSTNHRFKHSFNHLVVFSYYSYTKMEMLPKCQTNLNILLKNRDSRNIHLRIDPNFIFRNFTCIL